MLKQTLQLLHQVLLPFLLDLLLSLLTLLHHTDLCLIICTMQQWALLYRLYLPCLCARRLCGNDCYQIGYSDCHQTSDLLSVNKRSYYHSLISHSYIIIIIV